MQLKLSTKPKVTSGHVYSRAGKASQQKFEERESWHKLAVKVMLWSAEAVNTRGSCPGKVTRSEWRRYRQQIIKTKVTYSKKRVLVDLKHTFQKVKVNGGFEIPVKTV